MRDGGKEAVPILFFNGIGLGLESCEVIAAAMPDRSFLAFDAPGIGGSPGPSIVYVPAMIAMAGERVLAAHGFDRADVFGYSWGGAMAQQFALQYPGQVRHLILAATSPGFPAIPGDPNTVAKALDPQAFFAEMLADTDAMTRAMLSRLSRPTGWGYACQLFALAGWSSAAFLPFVDRPTLLLEGAQDRLVPPGNAALIEALLPAAQRVTIGGAGHLFPFSHPDETANAIREAITPPVPMRQAA